MKFKEFAEMFEDVGFGINQEFSCIGEKDIPIRRLQKVVKVYFRIAFRCKKAKAYCEKHGHKWVNEASIGPDSGSESVTCKRCGEYHHIRWY